MRNENIVGEIFGLQEFLVKIEGFSWNIYIIRCKRGASLLLPYSNIAFCYVVAHYVSFVFHVSVAFNLRNKFTFNIQYITAIKKHT